MRRYFLIASSLALAWPAAAAHAKEPLRLQPSSKWVIDYGDDSCRLARNFGEGNRKVTLIMDQFEPGDRFKMRLVGKPARGRLARSPIEGRLRFGPNEAETEVAAMEGTMNADPVVIFNGAQGLAPLTEAQAAASKEAWERGAPFAEVIPPSIGSAREAAVTWVEVTKLLRNDLVLETGPMDKPMDALRECSWDMVAHWGLNVEQQKGLTRRPIAKARSRPWFSAGDYPESMLRGGHQGIVHFRLMLDARGTPTSCHIQMSTRPKEFDDVVCQAIMKRARFDPALDAQGKPVASYWVQTVLFRME